MMDHHQQAPTPLSEYFSRMPNPLDLQAEALEEEEEKPPRRALTSYNIFFQAERARLLEERKRSGGKGLGFAGLARHIAAKWKAMGAADRLPYESLAAKDKRRYQHEKKVWKKNKKPKQQPAEEEKQNENETPPVAASPSVEQQGSSLASILGRPDPSRSSDDALPITTQSLQRAPQDASWDALLISTLSSLPPTVSTSSPRHSPLQTSSEDSFDVAISQLPTMETPNTNNMELVDMEPIRTFSTCSSPMNQEQPDSKPPPVAVDALNDDDFTPIELCSVIDHRHSAPHLMVQHLSDSLGEDGVQYFVNCFR